MLNLKVKTLSYYLGCFLYTHTHTQDLIVSLIFYNISIAIVNHLTTDIQYIQWHQLILILIVNIYLQLFDHGLKRSVKVYNTYFTFKVTTFEQWLTSVCYGRPLLQNTIPVQLFRHVKLAYITRPLIINSNQQPTRTD